MAPALDGRGYHRVAAGRAARLAGDALAGNNPNIMSLDGIGGALHLENGNTGGLRAVLELPKGIAQDGNSS